MSNHADPIRFALDECSSFSQELPDALAALDALLAENQRLQETVRLREESQIPMIPHGAQQKMTRLEAENQRYEKLLRHVLPHLEGGHDEALIWAQNIREALAGDAE